MVCDMVEGFQIASAIRGKSHPRATFGCESLSAHFLKASCVRCQRAYNRLVLATGVGKDHKSVLSTTTNVESCARERTSMYMKELMSNAISYVEAMKKPELGYHLSVMLRATDVDLSRYEYLTSSRTSLTWSKKCESLAKGRVHPDNAHLMNPYYLRMLPSFQHWKARYIMLEFSESDKDAVWGAVESVFTKHTFPRAPAASSWNGVCTSLAAVLHVTWY